MDSADVTENTKPCNAIGSLWSGPSAICSAIKASFFPTTVFSFSKECQGVKESCVALVHSVMCSFCLFVFCFSFGFIATSS